MMFDLHVRKQNRYYNAQGGTKLKEVQCSCLSISHDVLFNLISAGL